MPAGGELPVPSRRAPTRDRRQEVDTQRQPPFPRCGTSQTPARGALAFIAHEISEGEARVDVDGDGALVVVRRISATGWYYVAVADEGELP